MSDCQFSWPITRRFALGACALALSACSSDGASKGGPAPSLAKPAPAHSSSMALSADGQRLFVVNPETDSVSELDLQYRTLKREILLAAVAPAPDPSSGSFTAAIMPRALALSSDEQTLYVTGQRSGSLLAVDLAAGEVLESVPLCSEPIGALRSADGASLFVACSQDASVVKVDLASLTVSARTAVANEPWALAWSADGATLLVSHFMGPGLTALDPASLAVSVSWAIPDLAPGDDQRLAHGQVRGLYDLAARPGTGDVWVAHALLGTDTPQPALDFESTAFPALSLLGADGSYQRSLTSDAQDVPGIDGAFADVVSGPHALAFTPEGDYLLMVDANSEDLLIVDAARGEESGLVRPLPGNMPDGIALSPDGQFAYIDERISGDVAVVRLTRKDGALAASLDGAAIPRLASDPMPAELRLGQHLFNSANSAQYPITTDHWIACATCHMEGRSDAVTWLFAQGPRDTPSNAGGMLGTGFLFRTADRSKVQDYWHTVNVEQGGRFDPVSQSALLDALTAYVNLALPLPVPPTTDPALVARGAQVFDSAGCGSCHSGPRFTDSGAGNPTLDLAGTVLLHDVGTCVESGAFPDVAHQDLLGDPRDACSFDTPSLSGVASSPPYLHDGSALTLRDAVLRMPNAPSSSDDLDALVEYLRSL